MKKPWFLLLGLFLFLTACATRVTPSTPSNPSISAAITASDRIDNKAVLVERWLKSH